MRGRGRDSLTADNSIKCHAVDSADGEDGFDAKRIFRSREASQGDAHIQA